MRTALRITTLCLSFLCINAMSASAFDGERKGFSLGIGIGPGYIHWSDPENIQQDESSATLQFDTRVGSGLTAHSQVYFTLKGFTLVGTQSGFDVLGGGVAGLGLSYYFSSSAPSIYVTGGAGAMVHTNIFTSYSGGPMINAGFGVEVVRHVGLEVLVIRSWTDEIYDGRDQLNIWNAAMTLNVMAY